MAQPSQINYFSILSQQIAARNTAQSVSIDTYILSGALWSFRITCAYESFPLRCYCSFGIVISRQVIVS